MARRRDSWWQWAVAWSAAATIVISLGCAGSGPPAASPVASAPNPEPATAPDPPAAPEPAVSAPAATLPKTPVAAAVRDWLELFNRGDEDAVHDFLMARFTPEFVNRLPVPALVAFHLQSLELYGALTPATVVEDEPHRMVLHAASAGGELLELTVEVEPEEPHRISALRLVPAEGG